jgi:DNA-binding MarR family transcriptional regulator
MARREDSQLAGSITSQAAVLSELVAAYLELSLKKSGLTLGAFELLSAVKGSPSATQADLAGKLGITPSSLCEAVRAAANKGIVEQEGAAKDRRAKRVILTRKGARALEEALRVLHEAELAATAGLSATRLSSAVDVLRQAASNLSHELP